MAISLRSMAMESSVLRGPWPGNRHATLRRGSHERKIVAGYAKSAYPITGKSCATRNLESHHAWKISMLHLLEYASTMAGADSVGSVDSSRRTLVQPEPFANSHQTTRTMTPLRKRGRHTAWRSRANRPP